MCKMEVFSLLLTILLSREITAQLKVCVGGSDGPCVGNMCPGGNSQCIQTAGGEVCCDRNKIQDAAPVTPTTTTTTATPTAAPCTDKVNPKTGVSDCPKVAYLCNNAVYYQLMTQQCPKTCNRCTGASTPQSATCVDKVNPKTGVSDCPRMAYLCNNATYRQLMTQQCPRTCNRCNEVVNPVTTPNPNCFDRVNPKTGVSDCPARASLCQNSVYMSLMRQQCPKTCRYC